MVPRYAGLFLKRKKQIPKLLPRYEGCPDTRDSTVYIEIQIPIYDVIKYKMEKLFILYSSIDANIFNKQITHRTSVEKEQGDIIVK